MGGSELLIILVVVGVPIAIIFFVVRSAKFLERGKQVPPATTPQAESKMQFQPAPKVPKQVELDQSPDQVVNILGQPEKTVNLGAKLIYVYKDMKIVFMDGKVSDVQ